MAEDDLTAFEDRLLEWLIQSDFEEIPWSSDRAAEAFKVSVEEIREGIAALTKKVPNRIYVHYKEGHVRIAAE